MNDYLKGRTMLAEMTEVEGANPYRVLIATVLSARLRDEVAKSVTNKLFEELPTPEAQRDAPVELLEELLHSSGFYRTKARYVKEIARIIADELGGKVPETLEGLVELPGVGRKVANCVLVYAFGKQAIPVDTHVHRISNRLGLVDTKTPEQTEAALAEVVPRKLWPILNETFVRWGKQVCKPVNPLCDQCVLEDVCEKRIVHRPRKKAAN